MYSGGGGKSLQKCASINPAPVRWPHGSLSVDDNWTRLACDVTHHGGKLYLSVIDCGPSRFMIWKLINNESAISINKELECIFREHGPPEELLMDNGASFRSAQLLALCDKWNVKTTYRCAYRPSGNGVVERCHRTIKSMAAKSGGDPLDMVFWYNVSPKNGLEELSVPSVE